MIWSVPNVFCANKPLGTAAQKLAIRHNTRTRPLRVGGHRFEKLCSPCLWTAKRGVVDAAVAARSGRDPIAPPRLGVRTTTPVPRQRFVRIRRALTRRGDGVLVW